MRLELEVLDGPQKGQKIQLQTGLIYGQKSPLDFQDGTILENHFLLSSDQKNTWNIECLSGSVARIGSAEVSRFALIKGLIFHIGQTAFKVVERPKLLYSDWEEGLKDYLHNHKAPKTKGDFFLFNKPLRLTFVQGAQLGEFYTLAYGPRLLGHNQLDINIKDPSAPVNVARFIQVSGQPYIENLADDRIKINGDKFFQHAILDGDLLTVGNDILELSIL